MKIEETFGGISDKDAKILEVDADKRRSEYKRYDDILRIYLSKFTLLSNKPLHGNLIRIICNIDHKLFDLLTIDKGSGNPVLIDKKWKPFVGPKFFYEYIKIDIKDHYEMEKYFSQKKYAYLSSLITKRLNKLNIIIGSDYGLV